MVFAVLLSILAMHRSHGNAPRIASPVALAIATLTRPLPSLLTPVMFWRWTWPQRLGYGALLVTVTGLFAFRARRLGPQRAANGYRGVRSARIYATEFRFNGGAAAWIESALAGPAASIGRDPAQMTRLMIGAITVLVTVGVGIAARHRSASEDRDGGS